MTLARRTIVVVTVLLASLVPAAADAGSTTATHGCRAWASIFQPVLPILGAGKIEVALPSYLPRYGRSVYPHAAVLQPPLTYQVWLTTSAAKRIRSTDILLTVSGNAGSFVSHLQLQIRILNGEYLLVLAVPGHPTTVYWYSKATGVTYSVRTPARTPLATALRIAGSLTPGTLRKTPITDFPPNNGSPGSVLSFCP